ncbi:MAG: toprim domain-containing protein [Patescibacteria group bacterium]
MEENHGFNLETPLAVTPDDIKSISDPSPRFRSWAWQMYLRRELNLIVEAVIWLGKAANIIEALAYLNRLTVEYPETELKVVVKDLENIRDPGPKMVKLRTLVRGIRAKAKDPQLTRGALTHQAVNDLFSGRLMSSGGRRTDKTSSQLELFKLEKSRQILLFDEFAEESVQSEKSEKMRLSRTRVLNRIQHHWKVIRSAIEKQGWPAWRRKRRNVNCLEKWLAILFGEHAVKLGAEVGFGEHFKVLTELTWAAAASYWLRERQRPMILFREINVIASRHHLGGGRIDALEVRRIGGKLPNRRQDRILTEMSRNRYKSVGHLIMELGKRFDQPVEVTVIDWKSLVGDVVTGDKEWSSTDLKKEPQFADQEQMKRYLTLIPLDCYLVGQKGELWRPEDVTLRGELWYLMPDQAPIVHEVSMAVEQMQDYFLNYVVLEWPEASRRALAREVNNIFLRHLVEIHEKGESRPKKGAFGNNHNGNQALPLFPEEKVKVVSVREIIRAHRDKYPLFADRRQILQIVGKRRKTGTHKLEMNYSKLLEAMAKGEVKTYSWSDPAQPFTVQCLMDDHRDSDPSMRIYPDWLRFWCFGCRTGGSIAIESVPGDLANRLAPKWQEISRQPTKLDWSVLPVIPEEHDRIMRRAQQLLALSFWPSPAVEYLRQERRVDPSLAYEYGAGYGNNSLIIGLMSEGYCLDDLIRYGFVKITPNFWRASSLIGLLQEEFGLSAQEITREYLSKKTQRTEIGYPYSVLAGRVTFPLKLEGKHTNFYGRIIPPTEEMLTHIKLSMLGEKVVQGGFNTDILLSDAKEVKFAEAVIDTLTLAQMGYRNVIALVGTENVEILKAAIRARKNIGLSLDYDKFGRKLTLRTIRRYLATVNLGGEKVWREIDQYVREIEEAIKREETGEKEALHFGEYFRRLGYLGIEDFTARFVADHRECLGREFDFNTWWQRFGCQNAPLSWEEDNNA